ncbi:MAG TPA: glycosyltransferase family 9 protein [Gemmatimonadaceae bacterium]
MPRPADLKLDRILIVMMSAVGDAVHVLPLVNAIKRAHPASRITWVLQPGPANMVRGHPSVDEVIGFSRSKGWAAFGDVRRELAKREFDLAINLQVYFKAGIVTAMARAKYKLGFDVRRARDANWLFTNLRIPPHAPQHVQDQYFEFLDYLGIPAEPVTWDLGPWEHERPAQRAFFAPIERPVASIVVGTSKAEKDWPPERWAEVVDALYFDHGLQPVLVGGRHPRELAAQDVIFARAKHRPLTTLGVPLRDLVWILDGSALVLSPDTGPLHMSIALDRPTIALMGYTNPKRVGPYRRSHDLLIDRYGDPGEDYPVSAEYRHGRMERITVADVLEKVGVWKERYAAGSAALDARR